MRDRRLAAIVLLFGAGLFVPASARAVDLAKRYPATLDFSEQPRGYEWTCGNQDIWRLKEFSYAMGDEFHVKCGPSQVVFGCHELNVVWAAVFPDQPGEILAASPGKGEHVTSVWLRFHPARLGELFPERIVAGQGDASMLPHARRLAAHKMTASWQADNRPMIPRKESLTFDLETREGPRRFYSLDTETGKARYVDAFRRRPLPPPKPLDAKAALEVFDKVWDAFDRDYAMFAIKPKVDWAKLRETYRPRAAAAKDNQTLGGVISEMLDHLEDLHVHVQVDGQYVPGFNRDRPLNANPRALASLIGGVTQAGPDLNWGRTSDAVGYINIFGLVDRGLPQAFDEVLGKMGDTKGLILDLRYNRGGSEPLGRQIAGRLLDRRRVYSLSQFRSGPKHTDLGPKKERACEPAGDWRYVGPVVMLQGQRTCSSAESFALMLAQCPQVITLGDRTGGSSGNPRLVQAGAGIVVYLPQWIDMDPQGKPFDFVGIPPRVKIEARPDDFTGDRDPVLAAALEQLRSRAKSGLPPGKVLERRPGTPAPVDRPKVVSVSPADGARETTLVEGAAVDAGKKPMAGVDVVAVALSRRPKTDVRHGATRTELLGHAKTDIQGRFRLVVRRTAAPDDIAVEVFAFRPGCAVDWSCLDAGQGEHRVTLCLRPELPLRGRALGPQGEPVARLKVSLREMGKTEVGVEKPCTFWSLPEHMPAWPEPVRTDGEGRFRIHGVAGNTVFQLEVDDERFARQWWEFKVGDKPDADPVTLHLTPPRIVEGAVVYGDTGSPVSGAPVALTSTTDGGFIGEVEGRTDSHGRFRLLPYYGESLGIGLLPPAGTPYLPLSRKIPWIEGTVKQSMRLTLEPAPVVDKGKRAAPAAKTSGPSPRPEAPPLPAPAMEVLPGKGALPREKLPGRIYAAASFKTKADGGNPEHIEGIVAIDPSTGNWTRIVDRGDSPRVSPDGKRLAFTEDKTPKGAWACDAQTGANPIQLFSKATSAVWSPDGKELVVGVPAPVPREYRGEEYWGEETAKWRIGADGSNPQPLPLPPLHDVEDWSPDGKWLATHRDFHSAAGAHLYVMRPDGTGQRQLTGPGYHYNWNPRFSPDGRWVLHKHMEPEKKGRLSIRVIDFEATTVREVLGQVGRTVPEMACWSPDGRYIAVVVSNFKENMASKGGPEDQDGRIVIVDVAGRLCGELRLASAEGVALWCLDWR